MFDAEALPPPGVDSVVLTRRTYCPFVGRPEAARFADIPWATVDEMHATYAEIASALAEEARLMLGEPGPGRRVAYRLWLHLAKDLADGPSEALEALAPLHADWPAPPRKSSLFGPKPPPAPPTPRLTVDGRDEGLIRDDLHARFAEAYERKVGQRLPGKPIWVHLVGVTVEASAAPQARPLSFGRRG